MDADLLAALTICRALHDGAAMLLFGAVLFEAFSGERRDVAALRVGRIVAPALAVIVVTALLRIPLMSAGMGDGWGDGLQPAKIRDVMVDTAFGRTWAIHLLAVAGLAIVCIAGPGRSGIGTTLASGLVVATLALSGHAAAGSGAAAWACEGVMALHLLAAGAWVGGLVQVLALVPLLARAERRREAALALKRFSVAGHGFVAAALLAGAATALSIAGRPGIAAHPGYVGLLGVKVLLVVGMAGLAVVNRYGWVPRLREQPERAIRNLARNTRAAFLLGCGALAAAGLLGLLDPP